MKSKTYSYLRTCKRCNEIYTSKQKLSRICFDCNKIMNIYEKPSYSRTCKRCDSEYKTFTKGSSFCENCNLNINRDKRKDKTTNTTKLNISWRDIKLLGEYKKEVLNNG